MKKILLVILLVLTGCGPGCELKPCEPRCFDFDDDDQRPGRRI